MSTAHHLREAMAHLDQAADGESSPLITACITKVRRDVELVIADVLRRDDDPTKPPACSACNGVGRVDASAPRTSAICPECTGEGVRRVSV